MVALLTAATVVATLTTAVTMAEIRPTVATTMEDLPMVETTAEILTTEEIPTTMVAIPATTTVVATLLSSLPQQAPAAISTRLVSTGSRTLTSSLFGLPTTERKDGASSLAVYLLHALFANVVYDNVGCTTGHLNSLEAFRTTGISCLCSGAGSSLRTAGSTRLASLEANTLCLSTSAFSLQSSYILPCSNRTIYRPDQKGQANMDVGQLVDIYKKYMTPLAAQGYKLALPVTSSAPAGFDLIKAMVKQCGGDCPYDFVPVHWYDVDFDQFKDYVGQWHDEFQKPVWVTEFACQNFNGGSQCDAGKIWWFMTQATLWMNNTEWIERYCAFGLSFLFCLPLVLEANLFAIGTMKDMVDVNPLNRLMDPNSDAPNALGKLYLGLTN